MKSISALLLIAIIISEISVHAKDVYIALGQSNMVGIGQITNLITDSNLDSEILLYAVSGSWGREFRSTKWEPMNQVTFTRGPERAFARKMTSLGEDVAIIKFAINGSSLIRDFHKDGTQKMLYQPMINFIKEGIDLLETQEETITLKGIIWLQGSGDSNAIIYAQDYRSKLLEFVNDIRQDLDKPNLPFVTSHHPASWSNRIYGHIVAEQQQLATQSDDNIWIISSHGTSHRGDEVHYTPTSMELMGARFAEAMILRGKTFDSFRLSKGWSTDLSVLIDSDSNGKSDLEEYTMKSRSIQDAYHLPPTELSPELVLFEVPKDIGVEIRFFEETGWSEYSAGNVLLDNHLWNVSSIQQFHNQLVWQLKISYKPLTVNSEN